MLPGARQRQRVSQRKRGACRKGLAVISRQAGGFTVQICTEIRKTKSELSESQSQQLPQSNFPARGLTSLMCIYTHVYIYIYMHTYIYIYAYIYTYIYIYIYHIYIYIYIIYIYISVCVSVCLSVCVCVCICAWMCTCEWVFICMWECAHVCVITVRTYIPAYVRSHIGTYGYVHRYIYTYIRKNIHLYKHVCVHAYIHTCIQAASKLTKERLAGGPTHIDVQADKHTSGRTNKQTHILTLHTCAIYFLMCTTWLGVAGLII